MCRAAKELLQTNMPSVMECLMLYIQGYMQNFAYNTLALTIQRNSCQEVVKIARCLQVLIGRFTSDEYGRIQRDKKYIGKHNPTIPNCLPHVAMIELARVQLTACTNPESDFIQKRNGLHLSDVDIRDFRRFLEETRYFPDLMRLADTLDIVCDQSPLFFKEYYLEAEGVTFFGVSSSLPVILSEYALLNYEQPELTSAVFYPLSIYDDAASTALRKLRSRFLYEEIKAEAPICLVLLAKLRILHSIFFGALLHFGGLVDVFGTELRRSFNQGLRMNKIALAKRV
jgi:hypothetical protein